MKNSPKWLYTVIKILLSVLAIGYVAYRIYTEQDAIAKIFRELSPASAGWMAAAIVLLLANMGLEAAKWQQLIAPFYPKIKFRIAIKAVLAGMATGIFTPNRVGEYAGRVLILEPGSRMEAVLVTFIDRICQMVVTLVTGLLALMLITSETRGALGAKIFGDADMLGVIYIIAIALLLITGLIILFPRFVLPRLLNLIQLKKWAKKIDFAFSKVSGGSVRKVLILSLARYLVFSTQYYLLMTAFGFTGDIGVAYSCIALVFLGKSIIPFLGFMELGIREGIAIEVMGLVGISAGIAFSSTFLLYLVNILLPSAVGVIFLRELKFPAKSATE